MLKWIALRVPAKLGKFEGCLRMPVHVNLLPDMLHDLAWAQESEASDVDPWHHIAILVNATDPPGHLLLRKSKSTPVLGSYL